VFGRGEGNGEGRGPPRSGTTPTTYRYTGQRWEAGLGLYFYRARWYDPTLGRFAQPDTLVPKPGDPQNFNRYAYVRNNPLRFTDPTGHWEQEGDEYQDPDGGALADATKYSRENHYQAVKDYAYAYYCANFSLPFEGSPPITDPFGSPRGYGYHKGVDFGGSFAVLAPYEGTVSVGSSGEAGMWKIRNKDTGEVKEWSVWQGNPPRSADTETLGQINAYLDSGEWEDIEPGWSHTEGTVVKIKHHIPASWSLETRLEHVGELSCFRAVRNQRATYREHREQRLEYWYPSSLCHLVYLHGPYLLAQPYLPQSLTLGGKKREGAEPE